MENAPLDQIYTVEEAAERLRLSSRAIIKAGRDLGACSRFGRTYLFSEADLLKIWEGLRAPPIRYAGRAVPAKSFKHDQAMKLADTIAEKRSNQILSNLTIKKRKGR